VGKSKKKADWDHKAKTVELANVGKAKIDVKIIDLVTALCDLGLLTNMSCESQKHADGRVWISFYQANSAVKFMELVANDASVDLKRCIKQAATQRYDETHGRWPVYNRWWVDCYVQPVLTKKHKWTNKLEIRISVRFPKSHLAEVTHLVVAERDREMQ
jgi:hypothetical protein